MTIRLYIGILRDSLKSFGRLFAFYRLTLVEIREESTEEAIKTFVFRSNRKITFKAGQYGIWLATRPLLGKPGKLFTVASAPEEDLVQFTTHISNSAFKQYINRFKPGDTLLMEGPIGEFVLPNPLPEQVVLVAGGIGVTPFRALAKHVAANTLPVKMTLIHSARSFHLFKDELHPQMTEAYYVNREELSSTLREVATKQPKAIYYISGPPQFVTAARDELREHGIVHIKTDGFLGY